MALGDVAVALCGLAVSLLAGAQLLSSNSPVRALWRRYLAGLDRELRFLMLQVPAAKVALCHLAFFVLVGMLAAAARSWELALSTPIIAVAPMLWLGRQRERKVSRIETQLDVWLLALANALKASPSLGTALASSASLVASPLREELELTLKENHLGAPVDRALLSMGERIKSASLSSVVATLLIARRTGGNLPEILERTAATLREMERLEGVVRTRTAESKAQAMVLGVMPFGLCAVLHWMDPLWLPHLTNTFLGNLLIGVAAFLWLGSILAARKILAVDI